MGHFEAILGHFEAILGRFVAILGHLRAMSGPSWAMSGRLRAILAETGFVYERSEGFTDFKRSLECARERGDCCIGGGRVPSWAILPEEPFFGPFLVQFLDGFWVRFGVQKYLQN